MSMVIGGTDMRDVAQTHTHTVAVGLVLIATHTHGRAAVVGETEKTDQRLFSETKIALTPKSVNFIYRNARAKWSLPLCSG